MTPETFVHLVRELVSQPAEAEWVEFKENNADPQKIGENISALSNSAALHRRSAGFIVWGIRNADHAIVGTTFRPRAERVGAQEIENWLATQLEPRVDLKMHEGEVDGKAVVVFEVQPASHLPVRFRGIDYVRIGTYTKKLADHPEKERALWALFPMTCWRESIIPSSLGS
jgi:ATP-dependent DNA helicase RecG